MIIILLNFLIAVITESYEEVATKQSIYTYVHKASLNQECYQLISFFKRMKSYKVVVFSYNKELASSGGVSEESSSNDIGLQYVIAKLKKLVKKENKHIMDSQKDIKNELSQFKSQIKTLALGQAEIQNQMKQLLKKKWNTYTSRLWRILN